MNALETCYCRKLVILFNSTLDTYIALCLPSWNAGKHPKNSIKDIEGTKIVFHVKSTTQQYIVYTSDKVLGVCTSPGGIDVSPWTHQAAIGLHCGTPSIECVPTLIPQMQRAYEQIAPRNKPKTDIYVYIEWHRAT